jgi:hypothetical protein
VTDLFLTGRFSTVRRIALGLLAACLVATMVVPMSVGTARAAMPTAPGMTVTWNGADVAKANDFASAMTISFNSPVDVRYYWNSAGHPVTVGTARLQMFYFGVALSTRDVVENNPVATTTGTIDMAWDPGILQYVLEGTYLVTASLIAPNGTTLWSENLWVHESAPYSVLAVIPGILILIGLYELYVVATSGKYAAKPPSSTSSSSANVTTSTSTSAGSPGAAGTPDSSSTKPDSSPPPSSGSP